MPRSAHKVVLTHMWNPCVDPTKADLYRFRSFEVSPVREPKSREVEVCSDTDADYFSVYGRLKDHTASCLGDFGTREKAEAFAALLRQNRKAGRQP